MPTYQFVCACGQGFEIWMPLAGSSAAVRCPSCGGEARRLHRKLPQP